MCPELNHPCYKWRRRLCKTATLTRPAQLHGYGKDHMKLISLCQEKCCHIIWFYEKTDFFPVKQKIQIHGRKKKNILYLLSVRSFSTPFFGWSYLDGPLMVTSGLIKFLVMCTGKTHQKWRMVEILWITVCFLGDWLNWFSWLHQLSKIFQTFK